MAIVYYKAGEAVAMSSTNSEVGTTYVWKKGTSVISGQTGKDFSISAMAEGDIGVYTVEATPTAGDPVTDTFSIGLVSLNDGGLTPSTVQVTEGQAINLTTNFSVSFNPTPDSTQASDYSLQYQWKKQTTNVPSATSKDLTIATSVVADSGTYNIQVNLMKSSSVYVTSTRKVADVTVSAVVPAPLWYVIPLEYRNTSFTWIGYWVLDEIMATPGWFADHSTMKYKDEIALIVSAFNEYGDCLLMESRNGRILKVSDLK
ncbi:head outer capsid protein [Aeromonas phage ZPAH1]|nr:head outer capsid protein [Aeromonas phage Aswh_1]QQG34086.1 head outer capsid protein [Aeromonas phage ZPAH1]